MRDVPAPVAPQKKDTAQDHVSAFRENSGLAAQLDSTGIIYAASLGFTEAVGLESPFEVEGRFIFEFSDHLNLPNWPEVCACIAADGNFQVANWIAQADGSVRRYLFSITPSRQTVQTDATFLLIGVDVGGIVESTKNLELQAHQDPLTGLHNRRHLEATVRHLISACPKLGILVVDLDSFKNVNDTYGHEAGDTVLCSISETLVETIPLGETVVRLGGDEFVVVVEGFERPKELEVLAEEIKQAISKPISIGATKLRVSASVGTSLYPDHGHTLKELLYCADTEMYRMKQHDRQSEPQIRSSPTRDAARSDLIKELSENLAADQIIPFYQPIVEMPSGRIVGAEALCRLQRPGREMMLPSDFVPIAEANNLISNIDRMIFEKICIDLSGWGPLTAKGLICSFNLSAATLGQSGYSSFIRSQLTKYNVDPARLLVELTESMTLNEYDPERECIFKLRDLGVAVALDDFGTGFSSLSLLKSLPVSRIKIDRTFIRDIEVNEKDQRIVESIVSLALSIEAIPVAEGVENQAQADMLCDLGIELGQGFLFGKPMPFEDLKTRVESGG